MAPIETFLSEMFGFQRFAKDKALQEMIDDTLNRYDRDRFSLSLDDLAAAAGGVTYMPPKSKESD